jgi:hypothetical protein
MHLPPAADDARSQDDGRAGGLFVQVMLIVATLGNCWLGMQIVHELGHVLTAAAYGETISRVVLHPLAISRTDVSHDRCPLIVIWAGSVVGVLLPLGLLAIARALRSRFAFLLRFFAGFCLIANGLYLGAGAPGRVGDAGDLISRGSPVWPLAAFALVCTPAGLWLWHGLGPHFGLGQPRGVVDRAAARWSLAVFLAIVAVECLYGMAG